MDSNRTFQRIAFYAKFFTDEMENADRNRMDEYHAGKADALRIAASALIQILQGIQEEEEEILEGMRGGRA